MVPDLTLAQITLNRTRQDLGDARAQQAGTRSRLAEALGLSQEALEGLTFDADFSTRDANELTSAQARHVALRSRADILAALADYAAAEAGLQLEIARQYPDLHLGPGYAWNSGNAGDNEWSLGLTVDLPILDQNQGPIAEAEARRKLAAAKFIELQSRVIGEIDRGVADFQLAREQVRSGRELIAAEQQQQQSAEAQLHAGAGDPLDLLAAQLEVANAQLSQLDSEMKLQSAIGALEDALQRPADSFNPSLIPVSKDRSNTSSK